MYVFPRGVDFVAIGMAFRSSKYVCPYSVGGVRVALSYDRTPC